jgi:DNA-binding beta-propeller fold protein YncE
MFRKSAPIRFVGKGGVMFALLLLLAPSGAAAGGKKKKGPAAPNIPLVWPLPPEKPRIKYIQSIYGANDVESVKKASFLDRVAGIQIKNFEPTFLKPHGVAVDSRGRIYVSDSSFGIIYVLDRDQKKVTFIGRSPQLRIKVPLGITVDGKDRLWVADAVAQHVYAFDGDGVPLMALGQQGEMANPTSVAVDDTLHRLYVVDSRAHCVRVYDSESGQSIGKFGERGSQPGQFNFPTNIALDHKGNIYVTDSMNFRVEIFNPEYKFLRTFGTQGNRFGQFLMPKGIALDSNDNIYVVDADFDNFQIFDQQLHLLMFLGGMGQSPGTFWLPEDIYVDRNNNIYVTDQNNRRVQIFKLLDATTPASSGTAKPTATAQETEGGAPANEKDSITPQEKNLNQKEKTTP